VRVVMLPFRQYVTAILTHSRGKLLTLGVPFKSGTRPKLRVCFTQKHPGYIILLARCAARDYPLELHYLLSFEQFEIMNNLIATRFDVARRGLFTRPAHFRHGAQFGTKVDMRAI
jgi:hypothetical protein